MAGEKQTMAPPNTNITRQLYFPVVVAIVAVGLLFIVVACSKKELKL